MGGSLNFTPGQQRLSLLSDANISAVTKAAVTAWGIQQERKGGTASVLGTVARLTGEHWQAVNAVAGIARDIGIFGMLGGGTAGAAAATPELSATLSESERSMRVAAQLGFEPAASTAGFYTGLAGPHGRGPLSTAAAVSQYFEILQLGGTIAETWGGKYLNAVERLMKLDQWVWEAASSSYAWSVGEAGGRAVFLRGGAVNLGSIWSRLEAPILQSGNVPIQTHLRVLQLWE